MNNILAIFKHDISALKTNLIAAIVALGLMIVPPMYAWLTTLGFWDPYSSTDELKVAIADTDKGYTSSLVPTEINVGDRIISALHENDRFDWEFTDREDAIDGVESGKYYAAIVIPEDFSKKLMTVFSDDAQKAEIEYYKNEKENAIAPRITSAGATALETQIDETFTKTVADIALSITTGLSDFIDGEGIYNYASALNDELAQSLDEMDSAISQVSDFREIVKATSEISLSCARILDGSEYGIENSKAFLNEATQGLSSAEDAFEGTTEEVNTGISEATSAYDSISNAINQVFDSMKDDPAEAKQVLSDISSDLADTISLYQELEDRLRNSGVSQTIINEIDTAIDSLEQLRNSIDQAADEIDPIADNIESERADIDSKLNDAKQNIETLTGDLESTLNDEIGTLNAQLQSIHSQVDEMESDVASTAENISSTSVSLSNDLDDVDTSLGNTLSILQSARSSLADAQQKIQDAMHSQDLDEIRKIIGNNPSSVASFLSAPTELVEHLVYKIDNNGSSMSAFYTSLSLWIGAVFLIALTSTGLSRKQAKNLKDLKPWQAYLGRYGIFMCIALAQGLIVCLGNVFFVGVQCTHLFLYLLTGCICAIVFSNLVYTLVVSFGSVGKAIAIIGLVMQIGGSGGIFPIQMSAPVFQAIYPWLPFAHSMEAFQGCIAGIYGDHYLISILCLLAFLAASLLLGMVFRKPIIKLNDYVSEKMDETGVLI